MGQIRLNGIKYAKNQPNSNSESHTYSTIEHEVGVWIDGSTIYEKTIYVETVNVAPSVDQTIESNFVGNNIISSLGYNIARSGSIYSIPDGRLRVFIDSGNLKLTSINNGHWDGSAWITIQYTKSVL